MASLPPGILFITLCVCVCVCVHARVCVCVRNRLAAVEKAVGEQEVALEPVGSQNNALERN